jgi:predicted nucleotidyltransferase
MSLTGLLIAGVLPEMEVFSPNSRETLAVLRQRLITRHHPKRIILFGSQAKGTAHEGSDFDLLVVFDRLETTRRKTATGILSTFSDLTQAVDCIVCTESDIKDEVEKQYSIIGMACREGRVIYEA